MSYMIYTGEYPFIFYCLLIQVENLSNWKKLKPLPIEVRKNEMGIIEFSNVVV